MSSLAATTTTATTPISLKDRLLGIGLQAIARILEDFLARVTKNRLSPVQMLEEIVRLEQIDQHRRSLESRLRRARIGRFKPIADFDWNWPKKIERDLIERALSLDFIREGRNLAFIGTNGLGKTMIARNIAHQAVLAVALQSQWQGFGVLVAGSMAELRAPASVGGMGTWTGGGPVCSLAAPLPCPVSIEGGVW